MNLLNIWMIAIFISTLTTFEKNQLSGMNYEIHVCNFFFDCNLHVRICVCVSVFVLHTKPNIESNTTDCTRSSLVTRKLLSTKLMVLLSKKAKTYIDHMWFNLRIVLWYIWFQLKSINYFRNSNQCKHHLNYVFCMWC